MGRSAGLVMMLVAFAARAQTFAVDGELGLDLMWGRPAAAAGSDVVVRARTLEAPRGVRCGAGDFQARAVTVLERDCEVRVASGAPRRLRLSLAGGKLSVTLRSASPAPSARVFGEARLEVNGQPADSHLGALELFDDGRYRLGRVEGHWWRLGDAIALDGPFASWGRAHVGEDGLCLGVLRGPLEYHLCFPVVAAEVAGR